MGELTNFGGTVSFDFNFDDPAQMAHMLDAIRGVDSKIKRPKKNNAWMRQNGFYKSRGEFGIKMLDDDRFAVLYIPKGAIVHVDFVPLGTIAFMYGCSANSLIRFQAGEKDLRKHRADEAYVVALCKLVYEEKRDKIEHSFTNKLTLEIVRDGKSCKDQKFEYHTGAKLVIGNYDYDHDEACSEGIHYFTNSKATVNYAYDYTGWRMLSRVKTLKDAMLTAHGADLIDPWMGEQIDQFKYGWGKDIYELPCEDDYEEEEKKPEKSIKDAYRDAHEAIDKLVEAVSSIKPAERTDLGRYSYRYPARGTRCNCDAGDDSSDRPS